jgi:translation initiation factor IF-2
MVINKIDKPGADVNRIYQQLAEIGYVPEEWGGKTICVQVSAKSGEGIESLLEMILLLSDMENLKGDPKASATGVVVESHMDLGRGAVATILVQNGTLRTGDFVQIGGTYGKIRTMDDYRGKRVKEATPSMPVKISGIKEVAVAGEPFTVLPDEKTAKEACDSYKRAKTAKTYSQVKKINLESITSSITNSNLKELAIVVKADVQGSMEAILQALEKYHTPEAKINVVSAGVGDVSENDVVMASTASKLVIAFNVHSAPNINQLAKNEGVKISSYKVIYELLDDMKSALEELLSPIRIEIINGRLDVLQVFSSGKKETIAGGKVSEGKVEKGQNVKIMRNGEEVAKTKIASVRRAKDEVKEYQVGTECGLALDGNIDVQVKDQVVAYSIEEQKQTLDIKI